MWYVVTFDFKHSYKVWAHSEEVAISLSFRRYQSDTGKQFYSHSEVNQFNELELA